MATTTHYHLYIFVLTLAFSSLAFSERCHPDDKKALLQIKKDLKNHNYFISWDPKTDCCGWYKIECHKKTNRFIRLTVDPEADFNLPLPPAVGDLPALEYLTFTVDNLIGQIPHSISRLSNLRALQLTLNNLTGPIPEFLSQLKQLDYIDLAFNKLTGSIPASLSNLPKLTGLFLVGNRLTGTLPESFADFQAEGVHLQLSHNQLTGMVPRKWGNYNFFVQLDLSWNLIEGDISFLFGKNKSRLVAVDFSRNRLEFDMSKLEFVQGLSVLDLSHNRITGRLPEGLAELNTMTYLNVSYNRLCGRIPVGGNLQSYDYTAYFHNKCLCGAPLPECKRN